MKSEDIKARYRLICDIERLRSYAAMPVFYNSDYSEALGYFHTAETTCCAQCRACFKTWKLSVSVQSNANLGGCSERQKGWGWSCKFRPANKKPRLSGASSFSTQRVSQPPRVVFQVAYSLAPSSRRVSRADFARSSIGPADRASRAGNGCPAFAPFL